MDIRQDFVDAVGNTPLIKLRQASELTGCTILGKAEFANPGGSVKDRAAKYMVLDGERRGVIEPGGLIVEGTAGNTGIGLALVGKSRGYRTLILMPNTQSQEKKDALRLCGAELREVPAVPYKDPNHYVHIAARTAKELEATEQHWYQGNKSRIDTSVNVSFEGTHLGGQAASKEADAWYWTDFGSWKHIFSNARFYTSRDCGLTAYGSSNHSAWWEATIPPAVARYGQVSLTTISDLARQAECLPPEPEHSITSGGSSTLCYVWIEYDLYSGHIYSAQLLYCEESGGG
jgi:hypothetical protein